MYARAPSADLFLSLPTPITVTTTIHQVTNGLWHVFEWYPDLPEAAESLQRVASFLDSNIGKRLAPINKPCQDKHVKARDLPPPKVQLTMQQNDLRSPRRQCRDCAALYVVISPPWSRVRDAGSTSLKNLDK
jgi:hypothetical protein